MTKDTEVETLKNLSPGARIVLGSVCGMTGLAMVLIAPPTEQAVYFYAMGVFCFLIFVACVTQGKLRQFVGSLIGCALFVLSGCYLYSQIESGPSTSGSPSEPSVFKSIGFLIAFGIPGIIYAIKVKFGLAKKSEPEPSPPADQNEQQSKKEA